jgi:hypothetical protein
MWLLVLPSMPKGDIVGKYFTDRQWKIFNRQRMLVIDGKYNSDDGLSTTMMISSAVIIREEKQPCSLDLFLNSRWPSDMNKSMLKR